LYYMNMYDPFIGHLWGKKNWYISYPKLAGFFVYRHLGQSHNLIGWIFSNGKISLF
jgi:hypothetical protein